MASFSAVNKNATSDMKLGSLSAAGARNKTSIRYSSTINEIKHVLNEQLSKVSVVSDEWDTLLNDKTLEINNLKDTIRELRAKESDSKQGEADILQEGFDVYVGKRTQDMQQSLAAAVRERDEAHEQLEEQKNANNASQALVKEFKSKSEELTAIIAKMRSYDKYDVNKINVEIMAERDKLQRMYNELKVKYERNTLQSDRHFIKDKLDSICETISKTEPLDEAQMRLLWKQDLDELNRIYQMRLNQKELEWKQEKNKSIKTLDDGLKNLENRIKARLQLSFKEREESIKKLDDEYKHLEDEIKKRLLLSVKDRQESKQQIAKERSKFNMENHDTINVLKYKLFVIIFIIICIFFLTTFL